jgi:hypothetical protein
VTVHHLTPQELAARQGLDPEQVLELCRAHDIPLLHGRIDRSLFELALAAAKPAPPGPARPESKR